MLKLLKKISLFSLPWAIVLGVLDYRFHAVYWPALDAWRAPFESRAFFDFFSILAVAQTLFIGLHLKEIVKGFKQSKNTQIIGLLLLSGWLLQHFNAAPIDPVILNAKSQFLHLFLLPFLTGLGLKSYWTDQKTSTQFYLHWLAAFGALASAALAQYLAYHLGLQLWPGETVDFMGRLVWPYVDPYANLKAESANWLAYLAAPTVLIAAVFLTAQKTFPTQKALALYSALSCGALLILSQSYTGLGFTALALGLMALKLLPKPILKRVAVLSLLGLLLVSPLIVKTQKFQILLGNYPHPNSIARREQILDVTLHELWAHPILGIGLGDYQSTFRAIQASVLSEPIPERELPPHPHNLTLFWWSSLGLPGLILALYLYGISLLRLFKWFRTPTAELRQNPVASVQTLLPLYFLGHGLMDTPVAAEEGSTIFWGH